MAGKHLLAILALPLIANSAVAQSEAPEDTIAALFDAMRAGDGDAVRNRVRTGATLERATSEGVRDLPFEDWASWIDTLESGQADEQIFEVEVRQFGNLASVWAPFVISLDDEIRGCGVNHFTLALEEDLWIVTHGSDTPYDGDCETFQQVYKERDAG
ncbi:MAG: hypothetical protein AAF292_07435 [Pseudomonadota bacterium]